MKEYILCSLLRCLCRHDTVFINLSDKPEWYLDICPAGLVPTLIYDSKLLGESLLLADFLDEQYPQPPLYNNSPLQKILDKMFITSFDFFLTYLRKTKIFYILLKYI